MRGSVRRHHVVVTAEAAALHTAVAAWLRQRRATLAERAKSRNVPAAVIVPMWEEDPAAPQTTFRRVGRQVSPFAAGMPIYSPPLDAVLKPMIDATGEDLASELATCFAPTIRYQYSTGPAVMQPLLEHPEILAADSKGPSSPPGRDGSWLPWTPLACAFHIVYTALLHYLSSLPSLDLDDALLAHEVARAAVDFAASPDLVVVTKVLLSGLEIECSRMESEACVLRRLTSDERGVLVAQRGVYMQFPPPWLEGMPTPPNPSMWLDERVSLEVTARSAKGGPFQQSPRAQKIVYSLELLGYEPRGLGATVFMKPAWAWRGTGWPVQPMALASHLALPARTVSREAFDEAVALSQEISDGSVSNPASPEQVALQRFGLAMARQEPGEAIVDFVVALEALLLGDNPSELSHRFALNGAVFLASSAGERRALFDELSALYRARSSLVHGSRRPRPNDLAHLGDVARRAATEGLLKALRTGWPTGEDFLAALLDDQPEIRPDPGHE